MAPAGQPAHERSGLILAHLGHRSQRRHATRRHGPPVVVPAGEHTQLLGIGPFLDVQRGGQRPGNRRRVDALLQQPGPSLVGRGCRAPPDRAPRAQRGQQRLWSVADENQMGAGGGFFQGLEQRIGGRDVQRFHRLDHGKTPACVVGAEVQALDQPPHLHHLDVATAATGLFIDLTLQPQQIRMQALRQLVTAAALPAGAVDRAFAERFGDQHLGQPRLAAAGRPGQQGRLRPGALLRSVAPSRQQGCVPGQGRKGKRWWRRRGGLSHGRSSLGARQQVRPAPP